MSELVRTKGDVIVNDIKVGDIHYEFEYNLGIKCEVLTLPTSEDGEYYTWRSKNVNTGNEIEYGVSKGSSQFAPKLYTYEAYTVKYWI